MLPLFVRIAVPPPFALKKTPAAGRPDTKLMLPGGVPEAGGLPGRRGVAGLTKGVACQPPIIDPPDGMVTVTPPLPPFALIAVPNCPGVDTLFAVTCTSPVIKVGARPRTVSRNVPLSARIPTASELSDVTLIGPEAFTVTGPLPLAAVLPLLPLTATMPTPPPPWTVMPGPV